MPKHASLARVTRLPFCLSTLKPKYFVMIFINSFHKMTDSRTKGNYFYAGNS